MATGARSAGGVAPGQRAVALIRGINVGPTTLVSMAGLATLCGDIALREVKTFLRSGNVVFTTDQNLAGVADELAKGIEQRWGVSTSVAIRTAAQIEAIVAADPLPQGHSDESKYVVMFCDQAPLKAAIDELAALDAGQERFAVVGREVYVWSPAGVSRSQILKSLTAKRIGTTGTTRNWRTVTALAALL